MPGDPIRNDADWRERIRRGPVDAMVRDLDVSVRDILLTLSRGIPAKQVLADHPGLRGTDLRACLAYAAEVLRTAPPLTDPVAAEARTVAPSAPPVVANAGEAETLAPPIAPPDQVPTVAPGAATVAPFAVHVPGYEILEELGRGGMGVVYKARAIRLERVVALKMILAGEFADTDMLERFQREAKAAAQLPHAGIVQVYEVGEHDGRPYIVQEFVAGGSLASWLDEKPWSARQAAELVEAMAHAVQTAHDHGIIHRDLKPENVLMTEDGRPKIADFGLAKRMDAVDGKTRTGAIMGTPSYMAPEQAGGRTKEMGPATDVYALGAILYRLLTGRPPFRGADMLSVLAQVLEQEPETLRSINPKVPRDLETVALKCLAKEPKRRYDSAEALADDLRRFQNDEPVRARPLSAWERWNRWERRRPGAVILRGATLFVMLALLLVGVLVSLLTAGRLFGASGPFDWAGKAGTAALVAAALIRARKRPLVVGSLAGILLAAVVGTVLWNVPPSSAAFFMVGREGLVVFGQTVSLPNFFGTRLLAGLLTGVLTAALRSERIIVLALGLPLFLLLPLLSPGWIVYLATMSNNLNRVDMRVLSLFPASVFSNSVIAHIVVYRDALLAGGLLGLLYGGVVRLVRRLGGDPVDILCGAVLGSGPGLVIGAIPAAAIENWSHMWRDDVIWILLGCGLTVGAAVGAYFASLATKGAYRPSPTP